MLGSWNQIFWKNKQQQKPKRNVIFHPPYDHKNKIKNFEIFLRIYRTPIFFLPIIWSPGQPNFFFWHCLQNNMAPQINLQDFTLLIYKMYEQF